MSLLPDIPRALRTTLGIANKEARHRLGKPPSPPVDQVSDDQPPDKGIPVVLPDPNDPLISDLIKAFLSGLHVAWQRSFVLRLITPASVRPPAKASRLGASAADVARWLQVDDGQLTRWRTVKNAMPLYPVIAQGLADRESPTSVVSIEQLRNDSVRCGYLAVWNYALTRFFPERRPQGIPEWMGDLQPWLFELVSALVRDYPAWQRDPAVRENILTRTVWRKDPFPAYLDPDVRRAHETQLIRLQRAAATCRTELAQLLDVWLYSYLLAAEHVQPFVVRERLRA